MNVHINDVITLVPKHYIIITSLLNIWFTLIRKLDVLGGTPTDSMFSAAVRFSTTSLNEGIYTHKLRCYIFHTSIYTPEKV